MVKSELRENVKRGESDFPIELYHVESHGGLILPHHWHDEFEIFNLVSGKAEIRVGEATYLLNEGENLVINPGEIHSGVNIGGQPCLFRSVVFSLSMLSTLAQDKCQNLIGGVSLGRIRLLSQPQGSCARDAGAFIEALLTALEEKKDGYELYVKGCLYIIFSVFLRDGQIAVNSGEAEAENAKSAGEAVIKKVMDYISAHYSEHILLTELADEVKMSKFALCRCFKEYTGVSPIEYVNIQRVDAAYSLLRQGGCSVTDAALQSGFDNMSYFSKIFKKYKGTTPSSLKK